MRILHIAHYDVFPRQNMTFVRNAKNGVEQFLDIFIRFNNPTFEQYVLFFNMYDKTIFIEKIDSDGTATVYTYYTDVVYTTEGIQPILTDVLSWLRCDIVHIHYLQNYTVDIPYTLSRLKFNNCIATIHDETFLGTMYGYGGKYEYREDVARFFTYLQEVVFLHEVSSTRYHTLYGKEIANKSKIIANSIDMPHIAIPQPKAFKVVVLGSINEFKGSVILKDLGELNADEKEIELHLVGTIDREINGLRQWGAYTSDSLIASIKRIQPDIILLPSIVEEVFPYTALEATLMGYPIVCFRVGSLQKIQLEKRGWVVPETNASALYNFLKELKQIKEKDFTQWQTIYEQITQVKVQSISEMLEQYQKIYLAFPCKHEPINIEYIFNRNLSYTKQKENQLYQVCESYRLLDTLREQEATKAYEYSKQIQYLTHELDRLHKSYNNVPHIIKKIVHSRLYGKLWRRSKKDDQSN